jgi:hypothetical protein
VAGHVKGITVRALVLWYASTSTNALVKLHERRSAAARVGLDPTLQAFGILPSNWCANRAYHAIVDGIVAGAPQERQRFVRDGAAAIMDATMRGIYRSLFEKFATPALYSRYAQRAWRMYHDTGTCEVRLLDATTAEARVVDWDGHHPFLCDMTVEAGRLIFEMMGKVNVTLSRLECVSRGGDECMSTISWQEP